MRELAHAIEHAFVLAHGGAIRREHLPDDVLSGGREAPGDREVAPLAATLKQAERQHLLRALAVAGGKRARAAELLGISRKNMWEKLRAHDISDSTSTTERAGVLPPADRRARWPRV